MKIIPLDSNKFKNSKVNFKRELYILHTYLNSTHIKL